MTSTRRLTRIQFFAIKRELQSTNRRQADIGADYGFGSSTVSSINRAVTWENYLAGKVAKNPIRGRVNPNDPVVRKEKAEKAGLHPVNAEERRKQTGFAKELADLKKNPTREEFERLEQRVSLQARQLSYLTRIPIFGRLVRAQLQNAALEDKVLREREADARRQFEAHTLLRK